MKTGRKGTPFDDGLMFARAADMAGFRVYRRNSKLLRELNKRLKLYRGEDGWFAKGRHGQIWEYGKDGIGFTVSSARIISKAITAGFVPTQCGDNEANFSCKWNDENVTKLISLLRLRIRRPPGSFLA